MAIALGIIGAGNIFPAYLRTLKRSKLFNIVGVADAVPAAAKKRAEEFGLKAMTVDKLLASEATLILNLTPPQAHHAMGLKVLQAGKHFFTEKPLAASFVEGKEMVALAKRKKLRIGCAPDTFLGAGAQTTRALIDAGTIGTIRHGTAHFMCHGPDHWHPNPAFFYQQGAGPLMDVGVYYLTHLVNHLGPVASVSGSAHTTHSTRVIALGDNRGKKIPVAVPTHIVTHLHFVSGAQIVLTSSFDVWKHSHPPMEFYGDDGTILGHDPNQFGGKVRYATQLGEWEKVKDKRPYTTNSRGIGLIDMAQSIEAGVAHRCSEALALHVLEVMERSLDAARTGKAQRISTTCERPAPLAAKLF
jgi:predicted dehydrogenase